MRLCSTAGVFASHHRRRGKAGKPGTPVHDDLPGVVDEHGRITHEFTAAAPNGRSGSPTSPNTPHVAGDLTVARVDLSVDGGSTWVQADLGRRTDRWAWRLWSTRVDLTRGPHILLVRAWDDAGAQQPESPASLWNPKGYATTSWGGVEIVVDAA